MVETVHKRNLPFTLCNLAVSASANKLCDEGRVAQSIAGDLRPAAVAKRMVAAAANTYGHVDIRVNNPGIYPVSPILEMAEELWDRVLGINLKGPSGAHRPPPSRWLLTARVV